jgi:Anti-sigma factor NepR
MSGKKEDFRGTPSPEGGKAGGREMGVRSQKKPTGRLSRTDQHRIGDLLQRAYDDVVEEGVPDRFRALLDKLEPGGSGGTPPSDGAAPDQQLSSQISASANSQNRESNE